MGVCFSSSSVEPRDSADINLMASKPDASKKRGWFSRLSRRTPQGESGVAEEPPEPRRLRSWIFSIPDLPVRNPGNSKSRSPVFSRSLTAET